MSRLSTAALLTALVFAPATAMAQGLSSTASSALGDTSAAVSADVNANASASAATDSSSAMLSTDANASANASAQLTYDQLVKNMGNSDVTATVTAIAGVTSDANVTIIPVSSLEGAASADANAMATASASGSDRLSKLRAAVGGNATIEAKLTAAGYTDNDVVDVETNDQGAAWVYVQDKK